MVLPSTATLQDRAAPLPAQSPARAPRLGIIGDGQLARLTAAAALKLGAEVAVLGREPDGPATVLARHTLQGDWNDPAALRALAKHADVVTLENEFVEAGALQAIENDGCTVAPGAATIALVQDKLIQKRTLEAAGLPVAPFAPVGSLEELHAAVRQLGLPAVLKTRRDGYDGRGNATLRTPADLEREWLALGDHGRRALYVEGWCDFTAELATIVVRSRDGTVAVYPVVETEQRDHICHAVRAPARVSPAIAHEVERLARAAAEAVDTVGALGVECFLTRDGRVLINELAPRVHNSGHYTIEACACSQFENHVRAVLGLPLGSARMIVPAAVMVNLLGTGAAAGYPEGLERALAVQGASVHLYGKRVSAAGRKMGHVTVVANSVEAAERLARQCAALIRFEAVE